MSDREVKAFPILAVEAGIVAPHLWPDTGTGILLQATRIQERFFKEQRKELHPMLMLFTQHQEGPLTTVYVPAEPGDWIKDALPRIIEQSAMEATFLGAITTMEGYVTHLAPGEATHKNTRVESLIQTTYDKNGFLQIRTTPFHRETEPGLPIQDGPTSTLDRGEGESIQGRCVPNLRKI